MSKPNPPDIPPQYQAIPLIKRLLTENLGEHITRYAMVFVLMAVTAGMTAASAWIIKDVINSVFIDKQADLVVPIALGIIGIFVVKGFSSYASSLLLARVGARILAKLQRGIMTKVLAQSLDFYDRTGSGEITARFNQNASAARQVIGSLVASASRDALTVIALLGLMIYQDPILCLVILIVAPPAIYAIDWIVYRVRDLAQEEFKTLSRILQLITESVRGVRIIKSFNLEDARMDTINEAILEVEERAVKVARLSAITLPLIDTLGGVGIALIVLYGGFAVIEGTSDAGTFFSFIAAFLMAYDPAKRLARLNVTLQRQLVGVRLMYELLDEPLGLVEAENAPKLDVRAGRIRFSDVHFAYDEVPALRGLDLDIRPGEFLAVVGPSGSGKSTMFNLLTRFYDVGAGALEIDGQDIRQVSLNSLRGAISTVNQDPFLFSGSIRSNILLGKPDATDAEFERVVDWARVREFAERMPLGFDSPVGEGGTRLSGGQRQRVAIARAMLKNAPILLLDEATSALDTESERAVQEALEALRAGRTALVIAHRLSTVRHADRIAVVKDGRLVELGTHDDLLAQGGVFKMLYEMQFKDTPKVAAQAAS